MLTWTILLLIYTFTALVMITLGVCLILLAHKALEVGADYYYRHHESKDHDDV